MIVDDVGASALVRRARELTPLLAEHAAETERAGDLAPACAAALAEADMFTLFAPGVDADLATAVEVFATLARGCGSSSWVAMILSAGCALASLLDDEVRAEVWDGDPRAAVASVMAPSSTVERAAGGWRVSGRWQPASGVRHSRWILLGVPIDAEPTQVLVPTREVRIVPTWSVSGLQGTGSETVVAEGLLVPDRRVLSLARANTAGYVALRPDLPFAAVPLGPLLSCMILGPVLGLADAALAHAVGLVRSRGEITGTNYRRAAESPAVQISVATAAGLIDSAQLHADRAIGDVRTAMLDRSGLDAVAAARIRLDAGIVSVNVRRAVGLLLDVSGARTFAASNPLQRIWRDVEVACRHQLLVPDSGRESYGRVLLGVD